MKLYKTWKFDNEIKEVDATRTTESSVFVMQGGRERRNARTSEYESYFEDRQHAIDYLKGRAHRAVQRAAAELAKANSELEALNAKYPAVSK